MDKMSENKMEGDKPKRKRIVTKAILIFKTDAKIRGGKNRIRRANK